MFNSRFRIPIRQKPLVPLRPASRIRIRNWGIEHWSDSPRLRRSFQDQISLRCAANLPQASGSFAGGPIPESLAGTAFRPVLLEQGSEQCRQFLKPDFVAKQLRQPRSQWRATEIDAMQVRALSDDADFRRVRPRASIRTTRHTNAERLAAKASIVPRLLNLQTDVWPNTLAFSDRLAASG